LVRAENLDLFEERLHDAVLGHRLGVRVQGLKIGEGLGDPLQG
jgi:hypothetical protein